MMMTGAQAGFNDRMTIDPLARATFPGDAAQRAKPQPADTAVEPKADVRRAFEAEAHSSPSRYARRGHTGHGGQTGLATWYGPGFYGHKTASGERFTGTGLTAAHRSLPFGTRVRVVDEHTGRSVVVRINDRGPYRHGAIIDLSRASARALGVSGTARVTLVSLSD